jgi:excisionase family DNA binding protein
MHPATTRPTTSAAARDGGGDNAPRPSSAIDLRALPPTVDVTTAGRVLGIGRALAYRLVQRGEFPCRALRLGKRYLIPRAELLRALGVADPDSARPATAGQASAASPTPTSHRHHQHT